MNLVHPVKCYTPSIMNPNEVVQRIRRKDASLWKSDEDNAKIIRNSLGWLTVADEMVGVVPELVAFADEIRSRGFQHVMVCGMGGSSLCPEVLARTFGKQPGFPELHVLDSTDPDVIADFRERIDIDRCLFVVASKSGSTTEPNAFYKFWYEELKQRGDDPGANFIAITDPGSPLVQTAADLKFQRTFLNQPDIGGRYSALSYFGLVPAALMGLDIQRLLEGASRAAKAEGGSADLGLAIGEYANKGRNKLTLVIDQQIETLGLWIEQLIAESTGKEGKGILPVNGEPLGEPGVYENDRLFVSISLGQIAESTHQQLEALSLAGHSILYRELASIYDLGAEFFEWEFATACAGWRLGINPFDQPNVQEAKDATKALLNKGVASAERSGDDVISIYGREDASVAEVLKAHLASIKPRDYIAFLNYMEETPEIDRRFQELRVRLRDQTKCAVTIGYGPRYLHSTGQLHKGGPDTGVFFHIVADDQTDFDVPGESYSFGTLKRAQALGDYRALVDRGRRVIGIQLGRDALAGLDRLATLLFDQ